MPAASPLAPLSSSPLHIASARGYLDTVDVLLTHEVHINASDNVGKTPLHQASSEGHGMIAAVLLALGAQVHAANHHGNMPLILASSGGHTDVWPRLLNSGADPDEQNKLGESARSLLKPETLLLLAKALARNAPAGPRPLPERHGKPDC